MFFVRTCGFILLIVCLLQGCQGEESRDPLVVLIGLDGASLDMLDEIRSEGKLPTLDRLMRSGVTGPLQSWASEPIFSSNLRRGFWSPIVWTSIATGNIPEKHGVRDFVLPLPGTSSVLMGAKADSESTQLVLPELNGSFPLRVEFKLRSLKSVGPQKVRVRMNGNVLATVDITTQWEDISLTLDREFVVPIRNKLDFVFSRYVDGRSAELASLLVQDSEGTEIFSLVPALEPERLLRGFGTLRGNLTEVQSVHWRKKPFWSLLGDQEVPVGVIGYWGTWPAYPVEGFLVSSRMGIVEQRKGSSNLTWPDQLSSELELITPSKLEMEPIYDRLHLTDCEPKLIDQQSVLKKILIQDEFYVRMASKLLKTMDSGVFTIYLRSIDVAGHPTLHWRNGAALPNGCSEAVRSVVDETYVQIDDWISRILKSAPSTATVVIVSDHGMRPVDGGGHHAPFGLFVAKGQGIRRAMTFNGATVLDVAPTVMYISGASVPLDMDGQVLASLFTEEWLDQNPPRYLDLDTSAVSDKSVATEASKEALEQLRALGYIK